MITERDFRRERKLSSQIFLQQRQLFFINLLLVDIIKIVFFIISFLKTPYHNPYSLSESLLLIIIRIISYICIFLYLILLLNIYLSGDAPLNLRNRSRWLIAVSFYSWFSCQPLYFATGNDTYFRNFVFHKKSPWFFIFFLEFFLLWVVQLYSLILQFPVNRLVELLWK